MFSKKTLLLVLVIAMLGAIAAQCGAAPTPETVTVVQTVVVTKEVAGETVTVVETVEKVVTQEVEVAPAGRFDDMVTLHWNLGTEPPTIDPALATDTTSVDLDRNLFVGLTEFDPVTGDISPALATDWSVSDDGLVWTFNLRDDIPWVHYDPATGETVQVVDGDGNPRFVNAFDVEYGSKRTINPDTASDYSYVTYIIKNAMEVNTGEDADGNPTELTLDDVGVKALDAATVEFTLENPAGYFPAIAGMWILRPQPQWAIEQYGERWIEAGLIDTNGPYVLDEWIHGGSMRLVKNPLWINADDVQIEVLDFLMIQEASTAFALYENNELDATGVPSTELDRVKADPVLGAELRIAPVPCTYYYGFVNTKPPFDDVNVRRAFSAAIDRQGLIDNVLKGEQIPATTFAPPGIFGAPKPGTLGQGYDADLAKASLQTFLDEKGMTLDEFNSTYDIVLGHNTSEGHARIAAAIQQMWKDNLGVDVRVENQEWKVYLKTINKDVPVEDEFNIYRLGWCADYPDENNWVYEVFNSEAGANRLRRNCADPNCEETTGPTEFDDLTAQAGMEQDPAVRADLYAQAEDILAREEAAYAPIYHYTSVGVTKPWLTRNYPPLGGADFYNWTIDAEAQAAAMQ